MVYTDEKIQSYKKILDDYKSSNTPLPPLTHKCGENLSIYLGQYVCEDCGLFNGYVLGYFDIKERDRFFYKKKSIYNRKYHYEKKVNQISQRIKLSGEERDILFNELMKINDSIMSIQNKKFHRMRMINIFYLIKKILQEIGNKKYKLVYLKISPQTFEQYEKWWNNYLILRVK